ncbi:cytochrome P450 [Polyporus arcularius HHB13444]|uniref:Cytochrome P450 n=1 Tax=Polyporus arcularius HHB13444 TaxID=1314778 RepID=A0A5C3PN61_9APHY|nr:cytochrome P450 [Polyporus arcularius HHB13444]
MPSSRQWVGLNDLCKKYGNILHLKVFQQHVVILGSAESVRYLDWRSANTSDRHVTPSIALADHSWSFDMFKYGPKWRHYRRVFWQHFHPGAITKYRPIQEKAMHTFLARVLKNPSKVQDYIQCNFAEAILKVAYGVDVADEHDETVEVINAGVEGVRELLVFGGFLVDYLPFLRHVPSYLPGCGFMKQFQKWARANQRLRNVPYQRFLDAMNQGEAPQCILADILAGAEGEYKTWPYEIETLANSIGGIIFEAGADTTSSTLQAVFLAMSLYPEIQKKAHTELDVVVGHDRLPDLDDRDSLPYLNAIIKESLRWFPVGPLGQSHYTMVDDEFDGYFIPAGTVVQGNIWGCTRDPDVYEHPDEFRPERFIRDGKLDPNVQDPATVVFGFGRRICPGRHFADVALFINVAALLHVFDITPPVDEKGNEIKIEPRMTDCMVSYPEDSRCTIKPRGLWAEALIANAVSETTY